MPTRNQTGIWKYMIAAILSFIAVTIVMESIILSLQGRPLLETLFVLVLLLAAGWVRLVFPYLLI